MRKCPKCGFENPDGAMNCKGCRINLQFALSEQPNAAKEVQEGSAAQNKTINPRGKEMNNQRLNTVWRGFYGHCGS